MVTFAVQWTRGKLEICVLKMNINVAPGHSFVDDCEFEMSVRRTLGWHWIHTSRPRRQKNGETGADNWGWSPGPSCSKHG